VGWRAPVSLATFRDQMADYARAEKLRELRDAAHLSQEHVAHEVGVSTKTIRSWEHGGKIRWENAKRLGAFYGVDAEELVSRDIATMPAALEPEAGQLDRIEAKLNRILAALGLPVTPLAAAEAVELAAGLHDNMLDTPAGMAQAPKRQPKRPARGH
jgi:transcriptional regulator with XRE-family HTH domain